MRKAAREASSPARVRKAPAGRERAATAPALPRARAATFMRVPTATCTSTRQTAGRNGTPARGTRSHRRTEIRSRIFRVKRGSRMRRGSRRICRDKLASRVRTCPGKRANRAMPARMRKGDRPVRTCPAKPSVAVTQRANRWRRYAANPRTGWLRATRERPVRANRGCATPGTLRCDGGTYGRRRGLSTLETSQAARHPLGAS